MDGAVGVVGVVIVGDGWRWLSLLGELWIVDCGMKCRGKGGREGMG